MSQNVFEKIREFVKMIPKGMVSTYGDVARASGVNDARIVVWAIYGNRDLKVPCHRIVNKNGGLAKKFSLGGIDEHTSRLNADGVKVVKGSVNLKKYGFKFEYKNNRVEYKTDY